MLLDICNMEMDYNEAFEFYCFENCLRLILKYFGVQNSLLYIDATLNLIYSESQSDRAAYQLWVNTNRSSLLREFQQKVHVYKDESYDAETMWKINKERIDNGIPIVTGVDVFHLSYQSSFNKIHGAHGVILCGYSEDENTASVIDWYKPWFYKGNVEMEEYLKARSSKNPWDGNIFSGITIGNAWMELDRDGWIRGEDELVSSFVENTISKYYTNDNIERGNIPEREKLVSQGIFALKDILKVIERYEDADPQVRKDFLAVLHKNIFKVSRRKKLFRHYLEFAAQTIKLSELGSAAEMVTRIIEKWERMILTILKASMINTDKHVDSVKRSMLEVISHEEELYEHLIRIKYALGQR